MTPAYFTNSIGNELNRNCVALVGRDALFESEIDYLQLVDAAAVSDDASAAAMKETTHEDFNSIGVSDA